MQKTIHLDKAKILFTGLMTAFLISCEQESIMHDDDAIQFSTRIESVSESNTSRVIKDESGKGRFVKNDKIALFITPEGSNTTKNIMVFDGENWNVEGGGTLKWSDFKGNNVTFTAFYPVIPASAGDRYFHKVDENPLMNIPGEIDPDLLVATVTASKDSYVSLDFMHKMTLVELNLQAKGNFPSGNFKNASVSITADNDIEVNTATGELGNTTLSNRKIIFTNLGNGKFRTILCPQQIKDSWRSTEMFKIAIGSDFISYKAPESLAAGEPFTALEGGKKITFNLTVSKKDEVIDQYEQATWIAGINSALIPTEDKWGIANVVFDPLQIRRILCLKWEPEYGWFDVKKMNPDESSVNTVYPNDDSRLCWAASASNMLHWWMERNADNLERYGYKGPREYVHPFGSEIFDFYKRTFADKGGFPGPGIRFFFEGKGTPQPTGGVEVPHKGFFTDVFKDVEIMGNAVIVGGNGDFGNFLKKALLTERRYAIGFATSKGKSNHAMTIWGAHFDENGEPDQIYYTDNNNKEMEFQGTGVMRPGMLSPCGILKAPVRKNSKGTWEIEGSAPGNWIPILEIELLHDCAEIWERYFQNQSQKPQKGIVFAKGVTRETGWYDVNKIGHGETGDINMCWAAASSNMLQWWIDNYKKKGYSVPDEVPNGPGKKYQLAIFETFKEQWNNNMGAQIHFGLRWYLTGDVKELNINHGVAKPLPGYPGGFFKDVWNTHVPEMGPNYTSDLEGYFRWNSGFEGTDEQRLAAFTKYIVDAFKDGMAGLSIRAGYSNFHAITLWGYELDSKGNICRIFVTDSDDMINKPLDVPREARLNSYEIVIRNKNIGIIGAYDGFNMISDIFPFKGC